MCFLGLDTYEEGEMYVNGEETSGYREIDFENYRKKYIGNIFQSFNLVNSYTVYQNIELVLLINGYKKSEVKEKILDVIEKVDLMKYKHTKVSKLSGGQKQRVAIARALVKDTPILVADEPTGNLDSKSAKNIMALLHEVSKDKLMILVTHNYEQAEPYATRKIMMHDGKIIEDKKINLISERQQKPVGEGLVSAQINKEPKESAKQKHMKFSSKIRLGIRNTFNIFPKFMLLLAVYLVLVFAVLGGYSSIKKQEYEKTKIGSNSYFSDTSEKRIVIKKKDESLITQEDYSKIKQISNVETVVENDLFLDQQVTAQADQFGFVAKLSENDGSLEPLTMGRMPENENEVILKLSNTHFPETYIKDNIFEKDYILRNMYNWVEIYEDRIKAVGLIITDEEGNYNNQMTIYISKNKMDEARKVMNSSNSDVEVEFNHHILKTNVQYRVIPNKNVPRGSTYVFEELNYMAKKNNCKNQNIIVRTSNRYFTDEITLKITKTYNKRNMKALLGIQGNTAPQSTFYLNPEDYYGLFDKGNYQSSVFVKNPREVAPVLQALEELGYKTLYIKDTLVDFGNQVDVIGNAVRMVVVVIAIVILFFLSYFIIKIILKSRNVYYSTIRMLGATRKNAKQLLKIELFTVSHIAYFLVVLASILLNKRIFRQEFLYELVSYLSLKDYAILYGLLLVISLLISNRYARQLFQKSVMNTYKEEV